MGPDPCCRRTTQVNRIMLSLWLLRKWARVSVSRKYSRAWECHRRVIAIRQLGPRLASARCGRGRVSTEHYLCPLSRSFPSRSLWGSRLPIRSRRISNRIRRTCDYLLPDPRMVQQATPSESTRRGLCHIWLSTTRVIPLSGTDYCVATVLFVK